MTQSPKHTSTIVLISASLVSAVLGSIHSFSVFLEPLEAQFAASRSAISLTYSLALVALTIAVLFGPKIFARWSPATFLFSVCTLAGIGALLAGLAGSLPILWLGYSVIFGAANGLGYGFGLQLAAQAHPGREGFAMGVVTAAYALGAVLSPALFSAVAQAQGFFAAMSVLATGVIAAGVLSAILLRKTDVTFQASKTQADIVTVPALTQQLLWLGYFGGVLAGLMVIGHAAGISAALSPDTAIWIAPVVIAASNLLGSLLGGQLADKIRFSLLLCALALATSMTLLGIASFGAVGLMLAFALVGFAYGGTIAAYPAVIAKLVGMSQSARVYGRVFTAWGSAGLIGPWFAGVLFDWSGTYHVALYAAAGFGLISVGAILTLQRLGQLTPIEQSIAEPPKPD